MARHAQAEGIRYIGFRHGSRQAMPLRQAVFLPKNRGSPDSFCARIPQWFDRIGQRNGNGFPMIMISGSSDRAIVDLRKVIMKSWTK